MVDLAGGNAGNRRHFKTTVANNWETAEFEMCFTESHWIKMVTWQVTSVVEATGIAYKVWSGGW